MLQNSATNYDMAEGRKIIKLLQDARKTMAFHQTLGIDEYPLSPAAKRIMGEAFADCGKPSFKPAQPEKSGLQAAAPVETKISLQDIRTELGGCTRCRLHEKRKQIVFGEGQESAKLFIVGEWPSDEDDRQGKPFSGEVRELLNKMLAAIKMSMQDVYITNIVKCRPPSNRQPAKEEIKTCYPFLLQEISAVSPKVICAMGPLAAQALFNTDQMLFHLRGRFHDFQGIPLMPTFHPEFLIKNSEMKKAAWVDLQLIQQRCGK